MSNWDDIRMRLAVANATLLRMRRASADEADRERLDDKAQGVRLAISYMDDYRDLDPPKSYKAESFKVGPDYPCPNCGQPDTLMGYYLASEDGRHQHTRYICTYWPIAPRTDDGPWVETKPCGWSGWTANGPNKPLDMNPQQPVWFK